MATEVDWSPVVWRRGISVLTNCSLVNALAVVSDAVGSSPSGDKATGAAGAEATCAEPEAAPPSGAASAFKTLITCNTSKAETSPSPLTSQKSSPVVSPVHSPDSSRGPSRLTLLISSKASSGVW